MLNVNLTDDVRQHAVRQISIKNFGNRSAGFNGNRERQYTGIVGECIIHKLLNKEMPIYNHGSLIEDILINDKKIDIKTMARTVDMRDDYVHNFVGYQKNIPNDILLFNSVNKISKIVQVCGWLPKDDFLTQASFFEKGSTRSRRDGTTFITMAPLYEIENNKINPINNVDDILNIK